VAGPWRRIVEYPQNHLNDFCLFRALDGRWHAIGIMGTGTWASELSLFHSSGEDLRSRFENHAPLLAEVPPEGLKPQKHAPFVVIRDGVYHMFYRRPWGTILHLRSEDPARWSGLGQVVFEERDARDVCILQGGGQYLMYYCQCAEVDGALRSCILARTSADLETWSAALTVHVDTARPRDHSYLESPFVVRRPEGFYLLVRHRLMEECRTTVVLFSENPLDFGSGEREWFCELHELHAAEVVEHQGHSYVARVSGGFEPAFPGWVEVAPLDWRQ